MKKTHYNHYCHHQNYPHHHDHHHHCHCQNRHFHSFSSPLWRRLCLRSFGRMISNFQSSRLVTFQRKLDFQIRRLSYFLKNISKIQFVFSKTHSFLELPHQYSNLPKVYTIASSSSKIASQASYWENLWKKNIAWFCPHFGNFNFWAKFYLVCITYGANDKKFYPLIFPIIEGQDLTRALRYSPFQNPGGRGVPWAWQRTNKRTEDILVPNIGYEHPLANFPFDFLLNYIFLEICWDFGQHVNW